jgi:hypothetical protein
VNSYGNAGGMEKRGKKKALSLSFHTALESSQTTASFPHSHSCGDDLVSFFSKLV